MSNHWVEQIVQSARELEPPENFWRWASLSAISAVLKDQVWIARGEGYYSLYPNIYVMLYADSGLKKGPPVAFARKLVTKVNNTKVIHGRSSIQGIMKELATAKTEPGGKIVGGNAAGFIVASEFTSSLVADPVAMNILTDLYDRIYNEGEFKSLLKMETFSLKNPTVSMLVATNEAHFEDFIGQKDRHGGFMGRMFVIAENKTNTLNSLINKLESFPDVEKFYPYLKELSNLKGPFESLANTAAGKRYDDWYMEFYGKIRDNGIKDKTGTIQRFGDSVLKVAMLLSLSRKPELKIDECSMNESIAVCEQLIGNIRKTTMGREGKSNYAMHKVLVIEELMKRENHAISRVQLNKKYWMHGNTDEWDNIMNSLETAGVITMDRSGGQLIYVMDANQVADMKAHMEGKRE